VKLATERALVQRLNVFQSMFESITTEIDFALRHGIKHERVVWIG
jgi:hypothetical protein